MRALIVAGGLGTRAHALTSDRIPKALLPVGGVPIAFHQLRLFKREGVDRVTVLGGHLGDALREPLGAEADALGLAFDLIVEPELLGTGGCLTAIGALDQPAFVALGDMLFDVALDRMADFHRGHDVALTIATHSNDHPRTSDIVRLEGDRIVEFMPRNAPRDDDERNLVPAGLFVASPDFFAAIPQRKADLMHDIVPALIAAGTRVCAYQTAEYMRDVGSPARHAVAERDLADGTVAALNARRARPAIFFDCDGVLNEEPGHQGIRRADQVVLLPSAAKAVQAARAARHLAIGATNRPQVARGEITFRGLDHALGRLEALLAEGGGVFDRLYFCPHHPDGGFPGEVPELKIRCECRKPGTLMLRWGFADLPVDEARSCMIGDSLRDIGAAKGAGVWAYGVRTGYGCRDTERYPGPAPAPDLMFADVGEAVGFATTYATIAQPAMNALGALEPLEGRPLMVAIAGPSRSGKSTLAHALVRSLADRDVSALHVRLDDWIVPASERHPGMTARDRNRADLIAGIRTALRAGTAVTAPGYDALSRNARGGGVYDPDGHAVVVLDGVFALDRSSRDQIDLGLYMESKQESTLARFRSFYRWKGLADDAIEDLWRARQADEWPLAAAQRDHADLAIVYSPDEAGATPAPGKR